MLRAINCILIILILLLTALFGIIALLIIATEQPEGLLDKLYANSHQEKINRNESQLFTAKPTRITISTTALPKSSTSASTIKSSTVTKMMTENVTTFEETTTQSATQSTTFEESTTLNQGNFTLNEDFDLDNATEYKLLPFDLKLKPTNAEKVMSIGMEDAERFYVAKANGELEFFNWTSLGSTQTEHLDVQIHRLKYLDDGRLVATETQTKSLNLLDTDYKIVTQLKLGYQALDLQIYVLSRLNGTIFVYDERLVQKAKIEWAKENSCNFIQPVDSFVFVSCDNAVLKLSTDGKIVGRATIPGALYSLAIYVDEDRQELWAAQRGKQEIHVYNSENLQFKYKMVVDSEENAVWSTIGFEDERVFVLDYVSNEIKFFTIN